jgi:hypothetical protein
LLLPPKKRAGVFFHTLSLLKGPRGKQEEDFLLFLIPCLVCLPSAIIILKAHGGKDGTSKPPRRSVLLFAAVAFFFFFFVDMKREELTHFGSPQI